MTPEQAWRDAADKGGLTIEFDSVEALQTFRFRMYKIRKEVKDAVLKEYQEALLPIESDRNLDSFSLPSVVTGLEGLMTMTQGPKVLWVGPDGTYEAHGIVEVKQQCRIEGDGNGEE